VKIIIVGAGPGGLIGDRDGAVSDPVTGIPGVVLRVGLAFLALTELIIGGWAPTGAGSVLCRLSQRRPRMGGSATAVQRTRSVTSAHSASPSRSC
jgi:hypothetical protein